MVCQIHGPLISLIFSFFRPSILSHCMIYPRVRWDRFPSVLLRELYITEHYVPRR